MIRLSAECIMVEIVLNALVGEVGCGFYYHQHLNYD